MLKYEKYAYIYPPRPEVKTSPSFINTYDTGDYVAQPKFNGSCAEIYLNNSDIVVKNRHVGSLTNFKLKDDEVQKLTGKGWRVLVGEYMNKSKKDKSGKIWNDKFVIFDILVNNNIHLVGTTYQERLTLLHNTFEHSDYDEYLYQITDNIFLIKSFEKDFATIYNEIVKIDMLEGLVLKRKNGRLENGEGSPTANRKWALKIRKPGPTYKF